MSTLIALGIVTFATMAIFRLNTITTLIRFTLSQNTYLNSHSKYQIAFLILAVFTLFLSYVQNPGNFRLLFSTGNIAAAAEPVIWFGIGNNRTWLFVGAYLSIILTLGTLTFVYLQFRRLNIAVRTVLPYVGWIVLMSLSNSFSEEAIFRLGIVTPLLGNIDAVYIALISALVFGLAHYSGMPNGLIGMLMAAILGWFLAKSVIETHGIFWAWFIHFIQDFVIYIGFVLNQSAQTELNKIRVYQR